MTVDLSVCIVNWNTGDLLTDCVRSVFATVKRAAIELIVVDNASTDGSMQQCSALFESEPQFHAITLEHNLGFAGGNNVALRQATGRYIVLLNPDTVVLSDAFDRAIDFLDSHPECGAMGPRLLNADGSLQPSIGNFPTLGGMFWEATRLRKWFPKVKQFSAFKRYDIDYDSLQTVDQPSGACLFVRRQAIDAVGALDERYFMYYEEVDWCFRIKSAGWTIYYYPAIQVVHLGGQSTRKNLDVRIVQNSQSKLRYFLKHYGDRPAVVLGLRVIMAVEALVRTGLLVLNQWRGRTTRAETQALTARYRDVLRLAVTRTQLS